jgi:hypothetical protein
LNGNLPPSYALEYIQSTPSSTWSITHNLGYIPIVRVFIGTEEVQPNSVMFPDNNSVIISFLDAQIGIVKLI